MAGLGAHLGTFRGMEGFDSSPMFRMKAMSLDEQERQRQEAMARAGMQMDQNALGFNQDMAAQRLAEDKRQFDMGLAENQAERADRKAIASKARDLAGGSDLTKREELLYDHLNYQLTIAKYMLSKAATSEDRAKYQAEIDNLNQQISKILQPGEQADTVKAQAPAIMPAPSKDAQPVKDPWADMLWPGATGKDAKDDGAKAPTSRTPSYSKDKPKLMPETSGSSKEAPAANELAKVREITKGLSRDQIKSAAAHADAVAAGSKPYEQIMDYPGALEAYEWWVANGKQGKPSDAWR